MKRLSSIRILLLTSIVLLAVLTVPVRADTQLNGLRDSGGGKGSFLYGSTTGQLAGMCFVSNATLTLTKVSFTLGNNTLLGGQVVLKGTLQAEVGIIPYTAGGTCGTAPNAFIVSNTIRIQDVLTNSFASVAFNFPSNNIVQKNSGLFVGLEITYDTNPGVNKGVEWESNSGSGQFDTSQTGCGLASGTISGNSCSGGTLTCGSFESCGLYLLSGNPPTPPVATTPAPATDPTGFTYTSPNPVTANDIRPDFVAPDINGLPFVYIALLLLAITLGTYALFRKKEPKNKSKLYQVRL